MSTFILTLGTWTPDESILLVHLTPTVTVGEVFVDVLPPTVPVVDTCPEEFYKRQLFNGSSFDFFFFFLPLLSVFYYGSEPDVPLPGS